MKTALLTLALLTSFSFGAKAQAYCTTPGDNGRSYVDSNGVTNTCVYPTLWRIGNMGWQKFSISWIANSTGGCTTSGGCWTVNNGAAIPTVASTSQTVNLFTTHDPYILAVRYRTTTACTVGTGTIELTAIGDSGSSTRFVSASTYDLTAAVSSSNFGFQSMAHNFPAATGTDTLSFTITLGTDNVNQLTACAFDIQILWGSLPL